MSDQMRSEIVVRINRLKEERRRGAIQAEKIDWGYAVVIGELEKLLTTIDEQQNKDKDDDGSQLNE